jgi:hypothetical protein
MEPILDNSGKLIGVQAGPTDKGSIDVWLSHQFSDV